jgi:hypothetical protein
MQLPEAIEALIAHDEKPKKYHQSYSGDEVNWPDEG